MLRTTWISFSLLFAAYSSFSWFLHHSLEGWEIAGYAVAPWMVWTVTVGTAVAEALMLTTFMDDFRGWIERWLKSDIGYFTIVMIGAMGLAVAFVWFRLFGYVLVLLASETLARLDLQIMGVRRSRALVILTAISLVGAIVGWGIKAVPDCIAATTTCWFIPG